MDLSAMRNCEVEVEEEHRASPTVNRMGITRLRANTPQSSKDSWDILDGIELFYGRNRLDSLSVGQVGTY